MATSMTKVATHPNFFCLRRGASPLLATGTAQRLQRGEAAEARQSAMGAPGASSKIRTPALGADGSGGEQLLRNARGTLDRRRTRGIAGVALVMPLCFFFFFSDVFTSCEQREKWTNFLGEWTFYWLKYVPCFFVPSVARTVGFIYPQALPLLWCFNLSWGADSFGLQRN